MIPYNTIMIQIIMAPSFHIAESMREKFLKYTTEEFMVNEFDLNTLNEALNIGLRIAIDTSSNGECTEGQLLTSIHASLNEVMDLFKLRYESHKDRLCWLGEHYVSCAILKNRTYDLIEFEGFSLNKRQVTETKNFIQQYCHSMINQDQNFQKLVANDGLILYIVKFSFALFNVPMMEMLIQL